jgi:hypothetical protein
MCTRGIALTSLDVNLQDLNVGARITSRGEGHEVRQWAHLIPTRVRETQFMIRHVGGWSWIRHGVVKGVDATQRPKRGVHTLFKVKGVVASDAHDDTRVFSVGI